MNSCYSFSCELTKFAPFSNRIIAMLSLRAINLQSIMMTNSVPKVFYVNNSRRNTSEYISILLFLKVIYHYEEWTKKFNSKRCEWRCFCDFNHRQVAHFLPTKVAIGGITDNAMMNYVPNQWINVDNTYTMVREFNLHWLLFPAGIYLFIVNNRNTKTKCQICSKLTIKTPKQRHWWRSHVFIVNFEHISHLVLVLLLLSLNISLPAGFLRDRFTHDTIWLFTLL